MNWLFLQLHIVIIACYELFLMICQWTYLMRQFFFRWCFLRELWGRENDLHIKNGQCNKSFIIVCWSIIEKNSSRTTSASCNFLHIVMKIIGYFYITVRVTSILAIWTPSSWSQCDKKHFNKFSNSWNKPTSFNT